MAKDDSITLSPKHGVNPSVMQCPICHKDTGVALFGKLKGDEEAPKYVTEQMPCNDCKKEYATIFEAKDSNGKPEYTGRVIYLKRECIKESMRDKDVLLMQEEDFQELMDSINQQQ